MFRIDGPGATQDNKFTEGDPASGARATVVTADWLNALQEELLYLIEQEDIEPEKGTSTQVHQAVLNIVQKNSASGKRFHSFPVTKWGVKFGPNPAQKPCAEYDPQSDRTFFSWAGPGWEPHVGFYDHAGQYFSDFVRVDAYPIAEDDDHGKPTLVIDSDGFIHIFYGSHGTPQFHAKTVSPRDISSWTTQSLSGLPDMTYPNLALEPSTGDIYTFFRPGSGHGSTYPSHEYGGLARSVDGGSTWSDIGPIIDLTGTAAAAADVYPIGSLVHHNGKMYVAWLIAEGASHDDVRKNIYVAYYNPADGNMYSVDGVSLGSTITYSQLSTCEVRSADNTNYVSLRIRSNGDLYLSWSELVDNGTDTAGFVARWDGTSWSVVDTGARFSSLFSTCEIRLNENDGVVELYANTNDSKAEDPTSVSDYTIRGGNIDVYISSLDSLNFSYQQRIVDKRNSNGLGFAAPSVPANSDKRLKLLYGTGSASATEFTCPIYAVTDEPGDGLSVADMLTRIPNPRREYHLVGGVFDSSSDGGVPTDYVVVDLSEAVPENASVAVIGVIIDYDSDAPDGGTSGYASVKLRRKGSSDDNNAVLNFRTSDAVNVTGSETFQCDVPISFDRKFEVKLETKVNILRLRLAVKGYVI